MAIIEGTVVGAETGFYTTEIEQSLRFNDDDSAYLSRTPASAGNRKTWTFSTWVKRGNLGGYQTIFGAGTSATNRLQMFFWGGSPSVDKLLIYYNNGTAYGTLVDAVYRDVSSWMHIAVAVDTAQTTASNRIKVYINGELASSTAYSSGYIPQNTDTPVNNAVSHAVGRYPVSTSDLFDGYLAETHFLDGIAVTDTPTVIRGQTVNFIDEFVELKNGVPVPKAYSGSYGTNGFYLDYSNGASIGADSSGNGNNWTPTNLASTDVMLDSPTNNFATLNSTQLSPTNPAILSEGNLKASTPNTEFGLSLGTFGVSSGKWYWEVTATSSLTAGACFGISDTDPVLTNYVGQFTESHAYYSVNGNFISNGSGSAYGATYTTSDIIGVALDLDAGTLTFYKNGTSQGQAVSGLSGTYLPAFSDVNGSQSATFVVNFGQDSSFAGNKTPQGNTDANGIGDFYYAPPAGYLALCTANLPEPAIGPNSDTTSDEHFNTVLYTGNQADNRKITGIGFQPDLVWLKERSSTSSHALFDAVRGVGNRLMSESTSNELYRPEDLDSFDADGFEVNNSNVTNQSGIAMVAWNWKADNTSGSTNTDGTITSTVSANVDAGFSIVSYTGTGANATVGHGLSQAPDMVVIKDRSGTEPWRVWSVGFSSIGFATLNDTTAFVSNSTVYSAAPTSSVVNIGTSVSSNGSGKNYIAYCFHSVEGYSKFGSYTGNGSTDGPFVYTGFRPAFVMVKRTDVAGNWIIHDNERLGYNPDNRQLYAHASSAESASDWMDLLSNGFKWRNTTGQSENASGGTYIFACFAENPFKYSNAR